MAKIEFTLKHGMLFGKGRDAELQYDVVLRELTAGDIIDASEAAEKVMFSPSGGAVAYTSNVRAGYELLRRQVESIGDIKGPIEMKELRRMHRDDLEMLQQKAEELDLLLTETATKLAQRGEAKPVGNTE